MKAISLFSGAFAALALAQTSAFASGFQCEGEGYNVKLYNRTDATRTPAVLVVSQDGASPATVLRRSGEAIHKSNRANTVRYTVEGTRKINADSVILQISFKEGREVLEDGETTAGQLILVRDDGKDVVDLTCSRYLKN
jgi:hypothetical protein